MPEEHFVGLRRGRGIAVGIADADLHHADAVHLEFPDLDGAGVFFLPLVLRVLAADLADERGLGLKAVQVQMEGEGVLGAAGEIAPGEHLGGVDGLVARVEAGVDAVGDHALGERCLCQQGYREEREEYEPHLDNGVIVYAGVDYEAILRQAEQEVDIILWDGGNNDFPFYVSDMQIVVADPHRAGHESAYYPGETNVRMADVFVINKVDTADPEKVIAVRENLRRLNPGAIQIEAASPLFVDDPEAIRGKRVLVVEDGPTLTHGEMAYGAGYVAARRFGASEIVDPRPFAVKSIAATYQKYPKTGPILPAMGYGEAQMRDLEATINAADVDMVIVGTPIDLTRVIKISKPYQRVRYELQEIGQPTLKELLEKKFGKKEES